MAQTIHCDGDGHRDALAEILISRIENGDTSAWCGEHFLQFCVAVVQGAEAAEAELARSDQSALANLEGSAPGPGELAGDGPDGSAEAGFPDATEPDDGQSGEAGPEPVQGDLGGPEAGDGGAEASEPTAEPVARPGGSTEPVSDAAEAIPTG